MENGYLIAEAKPLIVMQQLQKADPFVIFSEKRTALQCCPDDFAFPKMFTMLHVDC